MTLDEVIAHYGTEREAAYRLGYSEQALQHWKKKGIPTKTQKYIELMTRKKLLADKAVKPSKEHLHKPV